MTSRMSGSDELIIYVGTRKLVAFIGDLSGEEPRIRESAIEINPDGFEHGLVVNLEQAAFSIQTLLGKLPVGKFLSDVPCRAVLGNSRLRTFSCSSSQYYQDLHSSVTPHEIRSVITQTRSVATMRPLTSTTRV